MTEKLFRFEDPEIWRRAAATSLRLFVLADDSEMRRQYRFAEQLRAATLSVTNNIAEGSGSTSDAEFAQFLNIARRSVYKVANMLILLSKNNAFDPTDAQPILLELEGQSRMIPAFVRRLRS